METPGKNSVTGEIDSYAEAGFTATRSKLGDGIAFRGLPILIFYWHALFERKSPVQVFFACGRFAHPLGLSTGFTRKRGQEWHYGSRQNGKDSIGLEDLVSRSPLWQAYTTSLCRFPRFLPLA